jgi:putative ATPase
VGDLFSDAAAERIGTVAPLAMRLRPRTLDEFVGQEQVLGEGSALRLAIAEDRVGSMIVYGPPGSGKTTLARIVAHTTGAHFEEPSAVSATMRGSTPAVPNFRSAASNHAAVQKTKNAAASCRPRTRTVRAT